MVRTLISLTETDKAWLDAEAAREHLPATELIRRAVSMLRAQSRQAQPPLDDLLRKTSGIWKRGDAVEWQRRIRDEWPR